MSRIGKQPIEIPAGVKINKSGREIAVEGPKGKVSWEHHQSVTVAVEEKQVTVEQARNDALARAMHGTARQLINNMVIGVSKGFERNLEIVGVGYNAKIEKGAVVLQIGFCHPVTMPIPEGLTVETPNPTRLVVRGADKQVVGQFCAEVRRVRPPEPYKGKGIRYENEVIRRKAAKSFGSG